MLQDIPHTAELHSFVNMTQAHFFDVFSFFPSCFSNPDLRRSELSLDAVLQRTSSNSSSSSSPSSQGGSTERRGMRHARVQTRGRAAKQSDSLSYNSGRRGGSFPGGQRDVVYLSSALIHLSDVPRCTSDIRGDGGEGIGGIETGVVGRVQHWVRERSTKCREPKTVPKRLKCCSNESIVSNTGR